MIAFLPSRTAARLACLSLAAALAACSGSSSSPPDPSIHITAQPGDGTAGADGSVTIGVTATSGLPLSYAWTRGGVAIPGATGASVVLHDLQLGDDGTQVAVTISNTATSVASNAATVHVAAVTGVNAFAGRIGGPGVADGQGSAGRMSTTWGGNSLASDGAGTLYFTDSMNHTVRKLTADGTLSTLAGAAGQAGEVDGTGAAARFSWPRAIVRDAAGNLYVAETYSIRKITPAGVVTTLAGTGVAGSSVDGTGTAAGFSFITALAIGPTGTLYVADDSEIRTVTPAGVVSTLAGSIFVGSTDGTGSAAQLGNELGSLAVGPDGNLYVFDQFYLDIRKITPAGVVTTFSGTPGHDRANVDGSASAARYELEGSLAFGSDGVLTLFGSDGDGGPVRLRRIAADGSVTTVAASIGSASSAVDGAVAAGSGFAVIARSLNSVLHVDAAGNATAIAGQAPNPGSTDGKGSLARFSGPSGLAVDGAGNAYVLDQNGYTIRKVAPDGTVSLFYDGKAHGSSWVHFEGLAADAAGNVYGNESNVEIVKIGTDGTLTIVATGSNFTSSGILSDVRFTATGDLLACTSGGLFKKTAAGVVSTLNTQPDCLALATNAAGRIVELTWHGVLYDASTAGSATLLAGGTAGFADGTGAAARFAEEDVFFASRPARVQMTLDDSGNAYVIDAENNAIRKVTPAGVVTTVVGGPTVGSQVRLGATGTLNGPAGIAVRPGSGGKQLLVSDSAENALLVLQLP